MTPCEYSIWANEPLKSQSNIRISSLFILPTSSFGEHKVCKMVTKDSSKCDAMCWVFWDAEPAPPRGSSAVWVVPSLKLLSQKIWDAAIFCNKFVRAVCRCVCRVIMIACRCVFRTQRSQHDSMMLHDRMPKCRFQSHRRDAFSMYQPC